MEIPQKNFHHTPRWATKQPACLASWDVALESKETLLRCRAFSSRSLDFLFIVVFTSIGQLAYYRLCMVMDIEPKDSYIIRKPSFFRVHCGGLGGGHWNPGRKPHSASTDSNFWGFKKIKVQKCKLPPFQYRKLGATLHSWLQKVPPNITGDRFVGLDCKRKGWNPYSKWCHKRIAPMWQRFRLTHQFAMIQIVVNWQLTEIRVNSYPYCWGGVFSKSPNYMCIYIYNFDYLCILMHYQWALLWCLEACGNVQVPINPSWSQHVGGFSLPPSPCWLFPRESHQVEPHVQEVSVMFHVEFFKRKRNHVIEFSQSFYIQRASLKHTKVEPFFFGGGLYHLPHEPQIHK